MKLLIVKIKLLMNLKLLFQNLILKINQITFIFLFLMIVYFSNFFYKSIE